jgi:hypothetical protein
MEIKTKIKLAINATITVELKDGYMFYRVYIDNEDYEIIDIFENKPYNPSKVYLSDVEILHKQEYSIYKINEYEDGLRPDDDIYSKYKILNMVKLTQNIHLGYGFYLFDFTYVKLFVKFIDKYSILFDLEKHFIPKMII